MRIITMITACVCALGFTGIASAQTIPSYNYPSTGTPPQVQLQCSDTYTNCLPITSTNPIPVKGSGAGGSNQVEGTVASGATDSGNPVKVGCAYTSSQPTLTNGQRGNLTCDTRSKLLVVLTARDGNSAPAIGGYGDGEPASSLGLVTYSQGMLYNGTTIDREPGTTQGAWVNAAPSAAGSVALTPVVGSLVNGIVGSAVPANLYSVEITTGALTSYLYVFNSATVPADGAVTAGTGNGAYQFCRAIAATTSGAFNYDIPERYSVGVSLAVSSTACGTLTKVATAVFLKARVK